MLSTKSALTFRRAGIRSLDRLADCKTVVDTKLATGSDSLSVPADFPEPAAVQQLQKQCRVQVLHLPEVIHHIGELDPAKIDPAGLLVTLKIATSYQAEDSTKCTAGTVTSSFEVWCAMAGSISQKAWWRISFFEIEHYGGVLNANRTALTI